VGRKLYYYAEDHPSNRITDEEWEDICRLQRWYNSEFVWTAGRLAFKTYAVFPNWEYLAIDRNSYWAAVKQRSQELRTKPMRENEVIRTLEKERLIIVKKGGYRDGSLASGFTKVASNEFNAYLVCDFLLKVSTIARNCDFRIRDEGRFIKCREVSVRAGKVRARVREGGGYGRVRELVENRRLFSIVDPRKYDNYPNFKSTVPGFAEMEPAKRQSVLRDWNWLGFSGGYDLDGDDLTGYDLNQKVLAFEIVEN
jgi:hypothetical protein